MFTIAKNPNFYPKMLSLLWLVVMLINITSVLTCSGTGQFGSCMGACASGQYCFGSSNDCYCGPTENFVILHRKTFLILGAFLFIGTFITSKSYCMSEEEKKISIESKSNLPVKKEVVKTEDFRENIKFISADNLEDDDGKISPSNTCRPDKHWYNDLGRQVFLESR